MWVPVPVEARGMGPTGAGVGGWEPPSVSKCWEPNPGPLQGQQIIWRAVSLFAYECYMLLVGENEAGEPLLGVFLLIWSDIQMPASSSTHYYYATDTAPRKQAKETSGGRTFGPL